VHFARPVMTTGLCLGAQTFGPVLLLLLFAVPLRKGSIIIFLVRVKRAPNSSHVMVHDNALSYFKCHSFIASRALPFLFLSRQSLSKAFVTREM
jgi:hypothetical protein